MVVAAPAGGLIQSPPIDKQISISLKVVAHVMERA